MGCGDAAWRFDPSCLVEAVTSDVPTSALLVLTAVLAVATWRYARTVAQQRSDALLPLLHWQEPHVAVTVDFAAGLARIQLHIVLWNVGPGAARVRKRIAKSGQATWTFNHFDEPSIVPGGNQLIVQLHQDVPVTVSPDGITYTADLPTRVELCVQFEDVVERYNYTTRPKVEFEPLAALPAAGSTISSVPAPPTPGQPSLIPGTPVRTRSFDPDSRAPSQRKARRDREEC